MLAEEETIETKEKGTDHLIQIGPKYCYEPLKTNQQQ